MKKFFISSVLIVIFALSYAQNDRKEILQDLEGSKATDSYQGITAILKSASRLFKDKEDLTSVILVIPSGSTVSVLGSDSTFLNVEFEGNAGYIYAQHASINRPVAVTEPAPREVQTVQPVRVDREIKPALQQQPADRLSYLESKYGPALASKLYSGKIWKGMTSDMISDSWGSPVKINRTVNGANIKEEWVYRKYWLFLRNSILTDWGSTRN